MTIHFACGHATPILPRDTGGLKPACVCGDDCKCKPGGCPGACPVAAPGTLKADSIVASGAASYVVARSGSTDIFRAPVSMAASISSASRPNLYPQTGGAGLVVTAVSSLPVSRQSLSAWSIWLMWSTRTLSVPGCLVCGGGRFHLLHLGRLVFRLTFDLGSCRYRDQFLGAAEQIHTGYRRF